MNVWPWLDAMDDGRRVPMQALALRGRLAAGLALLELEGLWQHGGDAPIEVVQRLALPPGAVLLGVRVAWGDEVLDAVVQPRAEARQVYDDALADGQRAVHLTALRSGVYDIALGRLAPGLPCRLICRLAWPVAPEAPGRWRFVLPLAVMPRYGEADAAPLRLTAEPPTLTLDLTVAADLGPRVVASPSHALALRLDADGSVGVTLAGAPAWGADVVLCIEGRPAQAAAVVADGPGGAAAWLTLPVRSALRETPCVLHLLLDGSGSMEGDAMQTAQAALHRLLDGLRPGDRFTLSAFGARIIHAVRTPRKVTPAALQAARDWVDARAADMGGTELGAALQTMVRAFAPAQGDPLPHEWVLVGDGQVEDARRLRATASRWPGALTVLAVGPNPDAEVLTRLAVASGGVVAHAAHAGEAADAAARIWHRLRHAPRTGLRLALPPGTGARVLRWAAPLPRAVRDGDAIALALRLRRPLAGSLTVTDAAGDVVGEATLAPPAEGGDAAWADTVRRCVVHDQVARLEDCGRAASASRLALAHGLASAGSDFVLALPGAQAHEGWPARTVVPQMLHVAPTIEFSMVPGAEAEPSDSRSHVVLAVQAQALRTHRAPTRSARLRTHLDALSDRFCGRVATPSDIVQRLNGMARADWPTTLVAAEDLGVPAWVLRTLLGRVPLREPLALYRLLRRLVALLDEPGSTEGGWQAVTTALARRRAVRRGAHAGLNQVITSNLREGAAK